MKHLFFQINISCRKTISRFLFFMDRIADRNLKKLESIKDIHNGKRCFIVCNGPSLTASDLDMIYNNNDISFASNKIDKIFNQTHWRPTYYCVMDKSYQYTLLDTMNNIPAKIKFFRKESYITTRKVTGNCAFLETDGRRSLLKNPLFSDNCTQKIYTIATVTYTMFQIAVHMGIKEIYIIGCDNSYYMEIKKDGAVIHNSTASYFSGSSDKDMKIAASTWEMNIAYEFARNYADKHNIRIFNATRGGNLEAFERINFDSLFK